VVALIIAVVPLTVHPIARSDVSRHVDPVNGVIPAQRLTFNCLSPFDRVERRTTVSLTDLVAGWVLGTTGFHEFVLIGPGDNLDLVVASDD
jgi:glycosylphosphatidylinositol transamidase (GPIT) subunit GPI8